ncbi:MAG: sigma 54-interacting transcriptional regulator [Acidobacteriota bacterium]
MYRLVVFAPDGVQRFPISRSEMLLGSDEGCDIQLPYTGVAQQHARLRTEGDGLVIEDLGSRRGVLVDGERVRQAPLRELEEIRLGSATLLVENVQPEAGENVAAEAEPDPVERETREREISAERMVEHLARLSEWVLEDVESRVTLDSLVKDLLVDFGGGVVILVHGELADGGIKLLVASDDHWLTQGEELVSQVLDHQADSESNAPSFSGALGGRPAWICAHSFLAVERSYTLVFAIPDFDPAEWSPVSALRGLGDLIILGLVHHVGWYEPILPGRREQPDLTLDSSLLAGESAPMKQVLLELRGAIDPPVHVLLRGESGVGKEALVRTLHISSSHRDGPLVSATCDGASASQIEADLFGAEIAGKSGPVRREGKLLLADGGTLMLDNVEALPLELQGRLVRFLRTGAIEPAGSRETVQVEVRLVACSGGPLEPFVARDQFRIDLAYRLSQVAIDVPAVRDRREDLPLLIQSFINQFCHETGKRMQGITVKAKAALLAYDYPGNLKELENITRQLVYLCPPGQPVDFNLLPEKVRLSAVSPPSAADLSDLNLDRLVATTEEVAIREAMKQTGGNKTQAARLLGLSRNGLTAKMKRYGIDE